MSKWVAHLYLCCLASVGGVEKRRVSTTFRPEPQSGSPLRTHLVLSIATVLQSLSRYSPILWNLRFITKFMRTSLNTQTKHEQSNSILIQFLEIHFNIILPCSQRLSEWTLSFPFPKQKFVQDYFHCHFVTVLWYPSIWQAGYIMKLHKIHSFLPNSSVFKHYSHHSVLKHNQLMNGKSTPKP